MAFAYLVLDQGLRFVRTRRWLRRHASQLEQVIDAHIEHKITFSSLHIWVSENKGQPDFPEKLAAWRERERQFYRERPSFVSAQFFREHSLPPPPDNSVYINWRDWTGGVVLGLLITTVCVAGFLALTPCTG
jgi:hypothetical protein